MTEPETTPRRGRRARALSPEELAALVDRYGDERKTTILPFDGEMTVEDLIPREDVVMTITRGGYVKRTRTNAYRAQRRGGKGVRGAQLRGDDVVEHFSVTSTHNWQLFFTTLGRVYRAKGYELPEGGRDAKGQHVANLLAFQPDEHIASVVDIADYEAADYLVLATERGLVKKTRLTDYESARQGGLIAINLREDSDGVPDRVIAARLVNEGDDILLVSKKGQSLRFTASDEALRATGRATSGVTGMRFRDGDHLLAMQVVRPGEQVFVVTEGGFAKRTDVDEYRVQGRGGLGIKVANLVEARGDLVSALTVTDDDEVLVIMAGGKVVRSRVDEVRLTGRNTQGVGFAKVDNGDRIIAVARNAEREVEEEIDDVADGSADSADPAGTADSPGSGDSAATPSSADDDGPSAPTDADRVASLPQVPEDGTDDDGGDA